MIKVIDWLIKQLTWIVRQVNKDGVNSEVYNYMYCPATKEYVSYANLWNINEWNYIAVADNIDTAQNWNGKWDRHIVLLLINLGKKDKFEWQNIISLSGGNWSGMTSVIGQTSTQQNLLDKYDNMRMEDVK